MALLEFGGVSSKWPTASADIVRLSVCVFGLLPIWELHQIVNAQCQALDAYRETTRQHFELLYHADALAYVLQANARARLHQRFPNTMRALLCAHMVADETRLLEAHAITQRHTRTRLI